jgi:hypothetical protein
VLGRDDELPKRLAEIQGTQHSVVGNRPTEWRDGAVSGKSVTFDGVNERAVDIE